VRLDFLDYLLAELVLFGVVVFGWLAKTWRKPVLFGFGFFLITVFPTLQIIPFGSDFIFADRYLYFPSIGLFYLYGTFFLAVYSAVNQKNIVLGRAFIATGSGLCLLFAYQSAERCLVFKDSISVWNDVAKKYPYTFTAYHNLGDELSDRGQYHEAELAFRKALDLRPNHGKTYYNLGLVFERAGYPSEAIKAYMKASEMVPEFAAPYINVGGLQLKEGLVSQAIGSFQKAISIDPRFPEAHYDLGGAFVAQNLFNAALEEFKLAAQYDPAFAEPHVNIGAIYLQQGKVEEALAELDRAIELDSSLSIPHRNRAIIYAKKGLEKESEAELRIYEDLAKKESQSLPRSRALRGP